MAIVEQSLFTPGTSQAAISYTGTAGTSSAIKAGTNVVRIMTSTNAFIKISVAGTAATTSDMYMPALSPEYFCVAPSSIVSAIQDTAAGNLYVTEMT